VHELDVLGEEFIESVLVDRVGVAAADLHELVAAICGEVGDMYPQPASDLRVAIFIDEPHSPSSPLRIACTM
jgi:hypothetical protein